VFNLEKATPQRRDFFLPNDMFMNERKSARWRVRPRRVGWEARGPERDVTMFTCFVSAIGSEARCEVVDAAHPDRDRSTLPAILTETDRAA
jgi:hypothetical protein